MFFSPKPQLRRFNGEFTYGEVADPRANNPKKMGLNKPQLLTAATPLKAKGAGPSSTRSSSFTVLEMTPQRAQLLAQRLQGALRFPMTPGDRAAVGVERGLLEAEFSYPIDWSSTSLLALA